jgi:hypothetical protein
LHFSRGGLCREAGDLGFLFCFPSVRLLKPLKLYLWAVKEKCRTAVKRKDGSFRAVPEGVFHCNGGKATVLREWANGIREYWSRSGEMAEARKYAAKTITPELFCR